MVNDTGVTNRGDGQKTNETERQQGKHRTYTKKGPETKKLRTTDLVLCREKLERVKPTHRARTFYIVVRSEKSGVQ